MEKLRVLIVEDNYPFAVKLEMNLIKWGHKVMGTVDNGEDALTIIQSNKPDLILMDIYLQGDLNGIELANKIKDSDIFIIYMTAEKDEETFQAAIGTKGISYLVKPFDLLSLKGAIEFSINSRMKELKRKPKKEGKIIYLKAGKELVQIDTADLVWIESDHNYCDLYTTRSKYTLRISLKKLMEQLPAENFMRIHNRYVVRLDCIERIFLSRYKVKVNGIMLSFGRTYKKELLQRIDIIK